MSVNISNGKLQVFNPATGKEVSVIPMTSSNELQIILQNAKEACDYNLSSLYYRKKLMTRFQKGIVNRMDEFIETICVETGKKSIEGLMEVFISLEHLKHATHHIYKALGKRSRRVGIMQIKKAWIEYEAMGVAGIISPWNYPLILTLSPAVEALLAGNMVVLKPSEQTPLTTKLLKEVWDVSTEKPEIFQVVYGDGDVGNALVKSVHTDVICFTGSTSVGRKIAEVCAPLFKPVILELGGKDPMIILEDADIERTIEAAIWGGLSNSGQSCLSVERIYIQEKIYPRIVKLLSEKIRSISSGQGDAILGAISTNENQKKIIQHIENARETSEIVSGKADIGLFIPPTLIINPPSTAQILHDETFGPVMTVHPFKTDNDAIKLANMTGYGLSASIFGKNKKRIKFIAKNIKAGTVSINDVLTHYGIADLPFGGIGMSGLGKVHGQEGLRAFSRQKSYLSNRISFKSEFWWFNKRESFGKLIRKWIKWQYK